MRRTFRTLNDYEIQHNAEVGLFTRPSSLIWSKMYPSSLHNSSRLLDYIPFFIPPSLKKQKGATKALYKAPSYAFTSSAPFNGRRP